jgi:hypothetical protein
VLIKSIECSKQLSFRDDLICNITSSGHDSVSAGTEKRWFSKISP